MDDLQEELDALERILCGQKEPDSLDFRLLRRLTGNFSDDRRIGEGGCGEVYKGFLPNGKVIAVKKLKKYHIIDEKMFLREVDSMIKVRHQNIVRFLGYCSEIKEKAVLMDGKIVMAEEREKLLCFPYMSNGSLDQHLTDELRGFEWHTRYQIIKGICDGLLHLHKEKGIIHMDLKPANILLCDQMVPKITDFGVSRIDGKTQITSAERLFSRGHAAPEYIDTGVRSWKSDIYSLGVIMIELVTGSRKIPNTTKVLRRWRYRWNKSSKHTPLSYLQVKKCLELAVRCQEINPVNRPFIWDVVRELNELDSWDGQITESSLEKIISSSDDMLGIEPLELYFPLAHEKQVSCSIELTNDTDYYMAFRIANTSLLPFSIQPDKGIVAPGSMCQTTIILPAQEMARLKNHREGFIVQSTRVDGSLTAVDITDDTFNDKGGYTRKKNDDGDKVVDEVNLTVLFDMLHEEHQKDQANLSAEMRSLETSSQEERDAVFAKIEVSQVHLEPLKRTDVLNDSFYISHDGLIGTINNIRLGRLSNVEVEWDEINAAWAQAALLLHTMAQYFTPKFQYRIKIHPMGSYPRVTDIHNNTYELFGPVNLFWSSRFDKAMTWFLTCLQEFADFAISLDNENNVPPEESLKLPYKIDGDKVGSHTIVLSFNKNENWTRALKYMLCNLKWVLYWFIGNTGFAPPSGSLHTQSLKNGVDAGMHASSSDARNQLEDLEWHLVEASGASCLARGG